MANIRERKHMYVVGQCGRMRSQTHCCNCCCLQVVTYKQLEKLLD